MADGISDTITERKFDRLNTGSLSSTQSNATGTGTARGLKYLIDCSSVSDALLRRPLPKNLLELIGYGARTNESLPPSVDAGWEAPFPEAEAELLALIRSALLVLARSHRFVKDVSKSTVALYKSLRSLLDNVNNRIVDIISQLFPSNPSSVSNNLSIKPPPFDQIIIPASSGSETTIFQLSHVLLPSIIHDIRKLLLTLHHNLEKHVAESADPSLLRLNSNEWQAILTELGLVIAQLYNWKAKYQT